MSGAPARGWSNTVVALLAIILAGSAGVAVGAPGAHAAARQGPVGGPSSGRFVVVPRELGPTTPDIDTITAEGTIGDPSLVFHVAMRDGFTLPADGYRLSLVVGDPAGRQTAATMTATADQVQATVLRGDAGDATSEPTVASWDSTTATATIVLPLGDVAPGSSLWTETAAQSAPSAVRTPAFSFDAFAGRPDGPWLAGTAWLTQADADGAVRSSPSRVAASSPRLSVANRALLVDSADRVPADLEGVAVSSTVDFVHLSPTRNAATGPTAYILVNRTTGDLTLHDRAGARVGEDGAWIGVGLPAGDPGAPAESSFDLERLAAALGQPLDPTTSVVRVDRTYTLADGRILTGYGTSAMTSWFSDAAIPTPTTIGAPTKVIDVADATSGSTNGVLVAAVAGALAVALIAVALVARGRRRRGSTASRARATSDAEAAPPEPSAEPGVRFQDVERVAPALPPAAPPAAPRDEPEAIAPDADDDVVPPADEARAAEDRTTSPEDALAALEADLANLTARVDRIGETGGDDVDPPAERGEDPGGPEPRSP